MLGILVVVLLQLETHQLNLTVLDSTLDLFIQL